MAADGTAAQSATPRPGTASTLRRCAALWWLYARLDGLLIVRGFRETATWYAADFVIAVSGVAGVYLLAERFGGLGPWTHAEVMFMLGFALTARAQVEMLFGWNLSFISRRIGRGQLDHMLIQPQPLWMILVTEGAAPFSGSGGLLAGAGLLIWTIPGLPGAGGAAWYFALAINLVASSAVILAWAYAWGAAAFWAPRGAEEINSQTMRVMDQLRAFPLDGLDALTRVLLVSVIPVGAVAWLPARSLAQVEHAGSRWLAPVVAALACAVAAIIFNKGLAHYGRTGSSRYTDQGHRR